MINLKGDRWAPRSLSLASSYVSISLSCPCCVPFYSVSVEERVTRRDKGERRERAVASAPPGGRTGNDTRRGKKALVGNPSVFRLVTGKRSQLPLQYVPFRVQLHISDKIGNYNR